jgi:hypothetical protein
LGLSDIVRASPKFQFVVAERTIVELHKMLAESISDNTDSMSVEYTGEVHRAYKTSAEEKKELKRLDEEFIRLIETTLTVENAPMVAELEPEKRDQLLAVLILLGHKRTY